MTSSQTLNRQYNILCPIIHNNKVQLFYHKAYSRKNTSKALKNYSNMNSMSNSNASKKTQFGLSKNIYSFELFGILQPGRSRHLLFTKLNT